MNVAQNFAKIISELPQGEKVYRAIYLNLKQRIVRGEFSLHKRIDTENDLATQYGVSIGTIRKTQAMLIQERILVKQQGRGTFVQPEAMRQRRVLWVCGVDVFDGDISPFYTHFLQACHQAGQTAGLHIDPAWLSHTRPQDSEYYLTDEALCQYVGFVFVGCEFPKHRLLYEVRERQLPHARLVHWQSDPQSIQIDHAQGVRLGVECLRQKGCRQIEVMGYQTHLKHLQMLFEELNVKPFATPAGLRTNEVEQIGYRALQNRLATDPASLPDGLLFMDDILTRGATRALLQNVRPGVPHPAVAMMSDGNSLIPLGLPVIHLVHDNAIAAQSAVKLVLDQLRGESQGQGTKIPFEVLDEDSVSILSLASDTNFSTITPQEALS